MKKVFENIYILRRW